LARPTGEREGLFAMCVGAQSIARATADLIDKGR